jgi:2'-hydroxyisoflavone reductase
LIVGPGDPTDRYTYWPVRIARGGEVMAPGKPGDPVQFIDVRDLAAFLLTTIEQRRFEIFNAIGPQGGISVQGMLDGCIAASKADAKLTWVDAEFLAAQQVEPWMHMTVWVPPDGEFGGLGSVDGSKAFAAGLVTRSPEATAADTLAWWNEQPQERRAEPRAGLAAERESSVLAAWHARNEPVQATG